MQECFSWVQCFSLVKILLKWLTLLNQVVECVNADALVVRMPDGVQKKIHFSSLRPPR